MKTSRIKKYTYVAKDYQPETNCVFCGTKQPDIQLMINLKSNSTSMASVKCTNCKLRNKFVLSKKNIIRNNSHWEIRRYYRFITTTKSRLSVAQKLLILETYKKTHNEKYNQVQTNN